MDSFEGLALSDVIPRRKKPWWRDGSLLKLNTLLLCALLTQTASGYDSSMLNGMQALAQWQRFFGDPAGTRLGAMTFGPTGGTLISVVVSAQLCERFGRRWPIVGGSLIIILGSILQATAVNYGMFVGSRFLVGIGLGIVSTAAPPLLTELAYPTHRGRLTSFYLVSWPLGSLIAAWVTYGTFKMTDSSWSWRIPSLLQCLFSILQAILALFCPESPRWLIYQGRGVEALDILAKYHGDGDRNARLVRFEMAEITATLEIEKMQNQSPWSKWFETRGNLHRFFLAMYIPAMLQWSGNSLTSTYLVDVMDTIGVTGSKEQLILNACLSVWSLLSASVFALLVDKVGRRGMFLSGMVGMLISYVIWTICSAINQEKDFQNKGFAIAVLIMIYIYTAFYQMCGPVAPTYIMEVVPFSLRSKGSMMYQLTGNLAGIYNSFANPVALDNIGWKYYIVWCIVITINIGLIYFFFPETKGRGLEEVAEIFDGPDALVGSNAMKQMELDNEQVQPATVGDKPDTIASFYLGPFSTTVASVDSKAFRIAAAFLPLADLAQVQTIRDGIQTIVTNAITVAPAAVEVSYDSANSCISYFSFEPRQLTPEVIANLTALNLTGIEYFNLGNASYAMAKRDSPSCKVVPGDVAWPSDIDWFLLDLLLGGALIKGTPVAAPCYPN